MSKRDQRKFLRFALYILKVVCSPRKYYQKALSLFSISNRRQAAANLNCLRKLLINEVNFLTLQHSYSKHFIRVVSLTKREPNCPSIAYRNTCSFFLCRLCLSRNSLTHDDRRFSR